MEIPAVISNPRYKYALIAFAGFTVLYMLANLLVIGGDSFIQKMNDTIVVPMAMLATFSAFLLWRQVKGSHHSRMLWGGMLIGWGLWTLAETIWAVYGLLEIEMPSPSIADFFWLAGYIPVGYALFNRLQEMPVKLTANQQTSLSIITVSVIAITAIFVLLPILQEYEPTELLASIIAVVYPLADLVLLIIGVHLLLVYRSGDYGFGWNLINVGFLLLTISDLVYSYAETTGIYYPEGTATLLSTLGINVPYNLSYLLWVLGIYALGLTLSKQTLLEKSPEPPLVANTHVLLFTKADGSVTSVSNNYTQVFGPRNVHDIGLDEALNILVGQAKEILDELRQNEKIADRPIRLENQIGEPQDAKLTGIAIINPQGEYTGGILCARILFETEYGLDKNLNDYQKSMLVQVRKLSGSREDAEIGELLMSYYSNHLKQLYNLAFHTGGAQMGVIFLERLRETTKKNQWPLQFDSQSLLTRADYPLSTLQTALPALLENAREFARQFSDDENELEQIFTQASPGLRANVKHHSAAA